MFEHYYNSEKPEGAQSSGWLHTAKTVFTGTFLGIVAAAGALVGGLPLAGAVTTEFPGSSSEGDSTALAEQPSGSIATVGISESASSIQAEYAALPDEGSALGSSGFYDGVADYQEEKLPEVARRPFASEVGEQANERVIGNSGSRKRAINGDEIQLSTMWSGSPDIAALRNNTLASFAAVWETGSSTDNVRLGFYDINSNLVIPKVITLSAPSRAAERTKNFPSPGNNRNSQFSQKQSLSETLSRRPSCSQSDEAQQEKIALSPTG